MKKSQEFNKYPSHLIQDYNSKQFESYLVNQSYIYQVKLPFKQTV